MATAEKEYLTPEEIAASGGDVDVAKINPGKGKGESAPVILPGFWVRLGAHKDVPTEFVGALAVVIDSPDTPVPFATGDEAMHGYNRGKKDFTVRTRDAASAQLVVPREAFASVGQMRVDVAAKA